MCSAQGQMPPVVRKQLSFNMHGHGTCSAHHIYGKVLIVFLFLVLGKQFFSILHVNTYATRFSRIYPL